MINITKILAGTVNIEVLYHVRNLNALDQREPDNTIRTFTQLKYTIDQREPL